MNTKVKIKFEVKESPRLLQEENKIVLTPTLESMV